MTISFMKDYINPLFGVNVFISDMQGRLLADTNFSGNGDLVIRGSEDIIIPARFMVTIVTPEMGQHKVYVKMNTYLYVSSGDWTLTGNRTDTLGHATISLTNLPALTGPVLYSSSGFFNFTSDIISKPVMLFKAPDDLFICIHTPEGPRFKWFPGITLNGDYAIDMGSVQVPETVDITIPSEAVFFESRITGYPDGNWDSPVPFTCDMGFGDGTPVTSIPVSYPQSIFAGFHTELMVQESWESPATWYYHVDGAIPAAFKKINATVNQMQATTGRLYLQTDGQFEVTEATWGYSGLNKPDFEWNFLGPDTLSLILIPELPPKFRTTYPDLSIDSLSIRSVHLMHFAQPVTYDGFLDLILKSSHPDPLQRLETSSVIWLPLQNKK